MMINFQQKRKAATFFVTALGNGLDRGESKIPHNHRNDAFEHVLNHALLRFA